MVISCRNKAYVNDILVLAQPSMTQKRKANGNERLIG